MLSRRILFVMIALLPATARGQSAPATADDIKDLKAMIQTLTEQQKADKADLDKKITNLFEGQREHDVQIGQISKKDEASGKLYVRLDAKQQPMKLEMQQAIADATPKKGKVYIVNNSDFDQYISVNGTTHFVMAHDKLPPQEAPIGEVRYRLQWEQVKRGYMVTPPYEFTVTIRNGATQPVATYTTYSPYYVVR
jgi:hypothetical protein